MQRQTFRVHLPVTKLTKKLLNGTGMPECRTAYALWMDRALLRTEQICCRRKRQDRNRAGIVIWPDLWKRGDNPDRTCAVRGAGIISSKPRHTGCRIQPATPTGCRGAEADRSGLSVPWGF